MGIIFEIAGRAVVPSCSCTYKSRRNRVQLYTWGIPSRVTLCAYVLLVAGSQGKISHYEHCGNYPWYKPVLHSRGRQGGKNTPWLTSVTRNPDVTRIPLGHWAEVTLLMICLHNFRKGSVVIPFHIWRRGGPVITAI